MADAATVQANKEIARKFSVAVKDTGLQGPEERAATKRMMDGIFIEDYVEHNPFPNQPPGRDGLWQAIQWFCDAFPDQHAEITHLIGDGDYALLRAKIKAHNKGPLMGIPPTGKEIEYVGSRLFHIVNGKVTECWFNFDGVGLMQQLGAVPIPPGMDPLAKAPAPPVVSGRKTTPEQNKAIMRHMIDDLWGKGDLSVATEVFHAESTSPSAPYLPKGPEGVNMIVGMIRSAFPDYWIRIDQLLAEDDLVFARLEQGGTHKGDFMGVAPTGKQVQWSEMGILRMAGGQCVESWYETDMLGLMQQLGVGQ